MGGACGSAKVHSIECITVHTQTDSVASCNKLDLNTCVRSNRPLPPPYRLDSTTSTSWQVLAISPKAVSARYPVSVDLDDDSLPLHSVLKTIRNKPARRTV